MTHQDTIRARAGEVSDLIESQLGVRKGRGLEAKLRNAGRRLPGWARRDAAQLVEAERLLAHPKLAMQTNPVALDQAAKRVEGWLKRQDPAVRRRAFWLHLAATNAFNMLFVAMALLVTLRLAGLV